MTDTRIIWRDVKTKYGKTFLDAFVNHQCEIRPQQFRQLFEKILNFRQRQKENDI